MTYFDGESIILKNTFTKNVVAPNTRTYRTTTISGVTVNIIFYFQIDGFLVTVPLNRHASYSVIYV